MTSPTPIPQLPPPVTTSESSLEFLCPKCMPNKRIIRHAQPTPEFINVISTSAITYPHERGLTCLYCNTYYVLAIAGANIQVQWGLVEHQRPSDIVIAPSGLIKQ